LKFPCYFPVLRESHRRIERAPIGWIEGSLNLSYGLHPLDPPRVAALDVVSSREIPDKGLRNRWPNHSSNLFVAEGSAEIL
jgi:hypothetical protein